MDNHNTTLGNLLPKEIKRNQELLSSYEFIGPAGIFGLTMIKKDIEAAQKAIMEGDVVAMLRSFNTLKENN